jgi:hypothetical protein
LIKEDSNPVKISFSPDVSNIAMQLKGDRDFPAFPSIF